MDRLDAAYVSRRIVLANTVAAAAASAWADAFHDREQATATVLPLVRAGMAQTVSLVDAYMAAKARSTGERGEIKGLNPDDYTVERLRGKPAEVVYLRAFGALGGQLGQGAEFADALGSGRSSIDRLVRTDIQLAQTHSSRDWISGEERIVGYERVLGPGRNCGLCVAASTQRYSTEDLMPIHERCGCSVAPIYGDRPVGRTIDPDTWRVVKSQAEGDLSASSLSRLRFENEQLPDVLRVSRDPELGLRLVDQRWAA